MAMLKALALVAAVGGVSALHPELRLFSDGLRQTVEVGRVLDAQEDALKAGMAKCIVALVPPSITSFYKCIGVDLGLVATGDAAASASATAAFAAIQKDGAAISSFTTVSKESCAALFKTKIFQCSPIMFASDPAAYLKSNPFPTSVDGLPAGCADVKTIVTQNATYSAVCNNQLNAPEAKGGSAALEQTCGTQPDGTNSFTSAKSAFATIFTECTKVGADPTSLLSASDASAAKAVFGAAPGLAASVAASVVLAAAAVVVAF
jgi:hypothetical protein